MKLNYFKGVRNPRRYLAGLMVANHNPANYEEYIRKTKACFAFLHEVGK